jgi:flagellin
MAVSAGARIATNINAMNSYNALNNISKKIGTIGLRLSTGIRLNQAGDDPASFTIARKMQAKSRAIAQSINNTGDAKSVLAIAEGGLINISDIMLIIKEKISQATNGIFGYQELEAVKTQVIDYLNEIDDIISQTRFSDQKLLNQNFQNKQFQIGPDAGDIITVSIDTLVSSHDLGLDGLTSVIAGMLSGVPQGIGTPDHGIEEPNDPAFEDPTNLNQYQANVDAALNRISMQIQYIGSLSNRMDFKETMLGVMQTSIDAAISRMYDADLAKEQMEMVKLQILQNTATAQLAQANAAPQLYLQLFQ